MTFPIVFAVMIALAGSQSPEKPVPKDSVEVEARGCLKGRMFTATREPEDEGVQHGPDVTGRHFRLSGKREVLNTVKAENGHRVAIVGLIKKSDLGDQGIGMKVGGTRVVIGAPGNDPNNRMNSQMSAPSVPVMDVLSVRTLSDRCSVP